MPQDFLVRRRVPSRLDRDAMVPFDRPRRGHLETHPQAHRRPTNRYLAPYICNLCVQYVRGGVITICGHLFCWSCLWPNLHNRLFPKCPRCGSRLVLHEDIMPFHGEGPLARSDDGEVLAQPESVPRPTGLYLCDSQFPNWFRLNEPGDVGNRGWGTTQYRDLFTIMVRLPMDNPNVGVQLTVIKWFQILLAAIMCILWGTYSMT